MPGLRWLTTLGSLLALSGAAHADDGPCKAPQPCVIVRTDKTSADLKPQCSSEQTIERTLGASVSLDIQDMPLAQLIEMLRKLANLKVIVDIEAVKAAGVNLQQPLSLKVEMSFGSALRTLLRQVRLTYAVQDEALHITAEQDPRANLRTVTYNVADLVLPIGSGENELAPFLCRIHNDLTTPAEEAYPHTPGMTCEDLLMRLICEKIAPDSWQDRGGMGTMQYFPLGMALVVAQTPDVHERIAEYLGELQRLQDSEDKEFQLDTRIIDRKPGDEEIMQLPRITFVRGQPINVSVGDTVIIRQGTIRDFADSFGGGPPEPVDVGVGLRAKVTAAEGSRLRLDVTLHRKELVEATRDGMQICERIHRVIHRVEPGQEVKVAISRNEKGEPRSWLVLTVNEAQQTVYPKPINAPQGAGTPCGDKQLMPVSMPPVAPCPGSR